jgi:DMSO/TMAO reductase YedYZ molybdopterin-dependent catalytic subunit
LVVLWRTGGAQNIHDVFFWRVRVGLHCRILRDTHKVSIREWIGVALRELFRDVGPKRQRAIAGTRS